MSAFGDELKRSRTGRGMSQKRLGLVAGLDHSYVCKLEAGERMPRRETVDALARALACSQTGRFALLTAAGFCAELEIDPSLQALNEYLLHLARHPAERERIRQAITAFTAVATGIPRLAVVRQEGVA